MKKKPFIVFEGLDGAGKSTLAKILAEDLEAEYICCPPNFLKGNENRIRKVMDEQVSLETRFLFYMLANSYVSDQVKEIRKSRIVICDRYIGSTLSIHKLLGLDINIKLNLEEPDISFFLYVSNEKERLSRINKRGKNTRYDKVKEDKEFRKKYLDYFKREGNFVFVDTANSNELQSLRKIKAELKKRGFSKEL